ncbi:MAG: peptidoglycan-binding protein [Rhodobacteraceae bacterium]|nr:peptidoglycan-binding protein [Paracoccaceae bacterium]
MKQGFILAVLMAGVALPVSAQDTALVIANENYRNASDISAADDALDAAVALERAGFRTRKGADLNLEAMHALLDQHYGDAEGKGHSVILLTGHLVHSASESWLVATDANAPSLASIGTVGLPLSTVFAIAAERPGAAVVLVGTEERRIALGRGLAAGIGTVDLPQGVTLFVGDAGEIAEFAGDGLLQPGLSAAGLKVRAGSLQAIGYFGDTGAALVEPAGPPSPAPSTQTDPGAETAFWDAMRAANTVAGYEAYLQRYPSGTHAVEARQAIAVLNDPAARARAGEDALSLSRDQRRQIQRDLSILDIDPKGIDGLFGPGSRGAIARWQRQNGHEATGFVTAEQIAQLAAQSERRAAELEAEAAARKAEQDRQDRLYWDQTGAAGDEPGLRAYLKRYPDGLFAELAQERLKVFDDARRQQAEANDRADWDKAAAADSAAAYKDYIARHPDGAFVEEARQKLADAAAGQADQSARDEAERIENGLGLNGVTRSIIEQRLAALGLKPGPADGVFDDDTRRAIRRYQRARGLPVTGYLTQQTVARILVDSL